ncbi:MAG: amidase [Anaerolineae bacterium]|nr:amidase [Anaerolineae bacterium]
MNNSRIQSTLLVDDVAQVQHGNLALSDMLATYQERFEAIEPQIASFIPEDNRFERLMNEAKALESSYPDAENRPPLYGALVGIKDIFHTDGFVTHAGTKLPPELFAGAEAAVVTKLKQVGALIVGKTVTTEFAFSEPGPTRNPHNLEHTPGGSSSGSAAAVAAGLLHLATGTQTVGSVIRPAAYCGTVGYKPSFDRINTGGLVYFSRSADHVGLFTQDVAGMHLVASIVLNHWDNHVTVSEKPVFAIPEGAYLQQASALEAFEAQVQQLQSAGYTVKRLSAFADIANITELHTDMIAAEFVQEHAAWFKQYEGQYRPRTLEMILRGQSVSDERLQAGRDNRLKLRDRLHNLMRENGVDAWICPPAPDIAPHGIASTGNAAMNLPWTHSGLPALTVPAGIGDKDLPLGLQICAKFGDDERLLAWASDIESVLAV